MSEGEEKGRTVVLKNGKVVRRGISDEERKKIRQETARKARIAMKEKRALEAAARAQEEAAVAEVLKKDSSVLGEEPLTDAREERYCQLVCSGVKEVEAWQRAYKTELGEPRAKGMTAIKERTALFAGTGKSARVGGKRFRVFFDECRNFFERVLRRSRGSRSREFCGL